MRIISSAELRNNMEKYLDIAKTERVIIQRGKTDKFVLTKEEALPNDFERGITKEELMVGIRAGIKEMFNKKVTTI